MKQRSSVATDLRITARLISVYDLSLTLVTSNIQ